MDKVEEKISVELGNKLIAEFMGYKGVSRNGEHYDRDIDGTYIRLYQTRWDWLMPVIKKLNGGRPHSAMLWEDITKALIDCDIERTWLAVVEYIKWFYKK